MLVRALANVVLCYVPATGLSFTTMERGHYTVEENGGGPCFAHAVAERLLPLATSRLVIENEFRADLEPELWEGDELTREIGEAGRRLDALGLLPAPFPIEELLSTSASCGTSRASTASAASPTATSPRARTRRASG